MIEARNSHGCSSFRLNGKQIFAVSPGFKEGQSVVEFLDIQEENPQWIKGTFLFYDL